jgi:hypothetical protein
MENDDMKPYIDFFRGVRENMQIDTDNGMTEEEMKIKYAVVLAAVAEIERIHYIEVGSIEYEELSKQMEEEIKWEFEQMMREERKC